MAGARHDDPLDPTGHAALDGVELREGAVLVGIALHEEHRALDRWQKGLDVPRSELG